MAYHSNPKQNASVTFPTRLSRACAHYAYTGKNKKCPHLSHLPHLNRCNYLIINTDLKCHFGALPTPRSHLART